MTSLIYLGSSHVTMANTYDYIISELFTHEPKVEMIQYVVDFNRLGGFRTLQIILLVLALLYVVIVASTWQPEDA